MSASTGSQSAAITVAELSDKLLPAIQDPNINPRVSALSITNRRNLANDVAALVVANNGTEEDALSIIETMDQFPDRALKTMFQQLLALGYSPLEIHHMISFATALGIKVMEALEWLKHFDVTLADGDEVDEAISETQALLVALSSRQIGTNLVSKGKGPYAGERKLKNPFQVADPNEINDTLGMLHEARTIGVDLNKRTLQELVEHFGGRL